MSPCPAQVRATGLKGFMTKTAPLIVWFREDLRLEDNPALARSAETARPLVALYILDETSGVRPMGKASRWWLDKSLRSLSEDLRTRLGGSLILRSGQAFEVLKVLIAQTGATDVHWNRLYDAGSITRDRMIKKELAARGVCCRSFNAGLINEPWEVSKADGGDYRVFTPYWRAASLTLDSRPPIARPSSANWFDDGLASEGLESWRLHPSAPDWSNGFHDWRPGETGAQGGLKAFVDGAIAAYADHRDSPALSGTSRLSPHLHFGEIGPRQIFHASASAPVIDPATDVGAGTYRKELGWREFNHHLLFHHPHIVERNFRSEFDRFPWRDDERAFEAWKHGQTGYPIVDAGMRELWMTGWMHNRVRMIVASFLTKHLLIDWRLGEAWFWDTLVDADIANNVGGWQWVAGSGADAAPYFRIFNPILQGRKYDPSGDYVRRWIPELAGLPDAVIHQPWQAAAVMLGAAGVRLGVDYPLPIVDHALARARALDAYRSLGEASPARSSSGSILHPGEER